METAVGERMVQLNKDVQTFRDSVARFVSGQPGAEAFRAWDPWKMSSLDAVAEL